ncbi:hypothetical protein Tco_0421522 [Tanacetum coccineum]
MVDWLSIVETDKVIHTMETNIVKLVVEIESFDMSSKEFDKETVSVDELQLRSVQDDTSEYGSNGEENPSDGIDSRVCMGLEKGGVHYYYVNTANVTLCCQCILSARVLSAASFENSREAFDKVFNHLDMLHAPLEGKVLILTTAKSLLLLLLNRKSSIRSKKIFYHKHPRGIFYPLVLNINYFRHFLDILRNYDPMDDEPIWAADNVVTLTPGSTITILETANEFSIKVIRVKQKQLNLGVGTERMIFNIDSAMKNSYLNDDTCFSIDVIDEILEEELDALLDKGSKILHSIKGTLLEEEIFAEFEEFIAMTADENSSSESDTEDPPFEKITINTDYKIKTSLEEPPMDLELKPLLDNLEYVFLEEPSFLPVIISSQLTKEKKNKLTSVLKKHKQTFAWKTTDIPGICPSFCKHKIQLLDDKKPVV